MTGRTSPNDLDADRADRGPRRERQRDDSASAGAAKVPAGEKQASMDEAIDRATAAVGQDDGKR